NNFRGIIVSGKAAVPALSGNFYRLCISGSIFGNAIENNLLVTEIRALIDAVSQTVSKTEIKSITALADRNKEGERGVFIVEGIGNSTLPIGESIPYFDLFI